MTERNTPGRRFPGKSGALRLWAPWLAGPLAWAAHQNVSYWLSSWLCEGRTVGIFLATTAALMVPPIAGMVLGWRSWRPPEPDAARGGRVRFVALVGALICAASLYGIVVETIPVFVLAPCGGIP